MRRPCLLVAVGFLLSPRAVLAQDDALARGIDPVSNKLAATIDGLLVSEGARTSPARSFRVALALDFASGLMALKIGDQKINDLIRHRLDLGLFGSYAITDWAEIALAVPVTVYQSNNFGALQAATGFPDKAPSSAGMGDLRVLGKFRLLREDRHYVTLSAIAEVRAPTGDGDSFLGERNVVLYPRAVLERTFIDRLRVGLDVGYRYRVEAGQYLNLYVGDELAFGTFGSFDLPRWADRRWTLLAEVLVSTPSRAPFTRDASDALKTPFEALLGVRGQLYRNFWMQLGGGTGFLGDSGLGREAFRLFATFGYTRVWRDRDHDGIADEDDRCPDQPEDIDGFEDRDGCPEPDNDHDGILDVDDQCPDQPGTRKFLGCADTDRDGIPDRLDRCPTEPGPQEYDGCPDRDDDEVADIDDKCPSEPGPATNDGCPASKPRVVYRDSTLWLADTIHFDTGKATIKPASLPLLDELAVALTTHSELKKLQIEGHTDNVGGVDYNHDLSQRRAQSVVDYLVARGIASERLVARGFGMDKPIATNNTSLGRAKNRRVAISILEQ